MQNTRLLTLLSMEMLPMSDTSLETQRVVERIAVLETKAFANSEEHQKMLEKLDSVDSTLKRYKGFVGGILFVLSGIWVILSMFKEWLIQHLGK